MKKNNGYALFIAEAPTAMGVTQILMLITDGKKSIGVVSCPGDNKFHQFVDDINMLQQWFMEHHVRAKKEFTDEQAEALEYFINVAVKSDTPFHDEACKIYEKIV